MASEKGRFFEVSKVRIGSDGHVSDVLWSEVNAGPNQVVGARVLATSAEVVDAIHDGAQVDAVFPAKEHHPERGFVIFLHENGRECIVLDGAPSPGRNLSDMSRLDA
jgi:hypothetical protein